RFQGTVYMDNLTVEKLDIPTVSEIGSFEQGLPSYWTKGTEPSGSTLSWATDQSISMGRSLKITKSTTTEAAKWESENMVDLWSQRHYANVDIKFGVYYKTSGVNTNPTTDDQKWFVSYSFYREDGSLIGEKKFELDQSVASTTDWVADTTAVGEISLTEDSWKTIIRFVGGKDATGTVWADDFIFTGRGGGWAGQDWNTQVGVPTGWFYWLPPNGGNDGLLNAGYQNTKITDEEAYQGLYSLKFENLEGTHDGFVGTRKYAISGEPLLGPIEPKHELQDISTLSGVVPGDVIRISVWIKGMDLHPDSAAAVGDSWSIAITPMFHNTIGNNSGFGDFWASDIPLKFANVTSFDWTQFYVDVIVPEGSISLSVRLHPLSRFPGTVYLDQLQIKKNGVTDVQVGTEIPTSYNLSQNYPNPFNPSTTINYSIPVGSNVSIVIYDLLGREVKTLINSEQNAGNYQLQWNGDNNYGSKVSSGTYFFSIRSADFTQVRKMILLK
ncbi:MAG: T9SS type A sorting domain-containing protein, partial [Candidatus Zixiibacteriota bacterium]